MPVHLPLPWPQNDDPLEPTQAGSAIGCTLFLPLTVEMHAQSASCQWPMAHAMEHTTAEWKHLIRLQLFIKSMISSPSFTSEVDSLVLRVGKLIVG